MVRTFGKFFSLFSFFLNKIFIWAFSLSLKSTEENQHFSHFFTLFATFSEAEIQAAQFLCLFIRFCPIESLRVETQRNAFLRLLISSRVEEIVSLRNFPLAFYFSLNRTQECYFSLHNLLYRNSKIILHHFNALGGYKNIILGNLSTYLLQDNFLHCFSFFSLRTFCFLQKNFFPVHWSALKKLFLCKSFHKIRSRRSFFCQFFDLQEFLNSLSEANLSTKPNELTVFSLFFPQLRSLETFILTTSRGNCSIKNIVQSLIIQVLIYFPRARWFVLMMSSTLLFLCWCVLGYSLGPSIALAFSPGTSLLFFIHIIFFSFRSFRPIQILTVVHIIFAIYFHSISFRSFRIFFSPALGSVHDTLWARCDRRVLEVHFAPFWRLTDEVKGEKGIFWKCDCEWCKFLHFCWFWLGLEWLKKNVRKLIFEKNEKIDVFRIWTNKSVRINESTNFLNNLFGIFKCQEHKTSFKSCKVYQIPFSLTITQKD